MTIDLEQRRTELVELRERLSSATQELLADDEGGAEMTSSAGDQHLADHASGMLEREIDGSIGENADNVLGEISAALARIDSGTYGLCASCGNPIPEDRLSAVPYATLCIDCKRRQERG